MRFDLPNEIDDLAAFFPEFLEIADNPRWWKRVDQLYKEGLKSPYQTKIMVDHHWLELEISAQISIWRENGRLLPKEIFPQSMAALLFVGMVVKTHKCLTRVGQKNLRGRLRDGLNRDFAGLYIELCVAYGLFNEDFEVDFADLEGRAAYDIRFQRADIVGEVECKSLSADAGRKIHRKDFYRFIDSLNPKIIERTKNSPPIVVVITVDDRMSADVKSQQELKKATSRVLTEGNLTSLTGPNFKIEQGPYSRWLTNKNLAKPEEIYAECSSVFGQNCHAAGMISETGGCLVIVRSRLDDDHSKPQLDALKKATSQLTGKHPGFIAIQFEDMKPSDLTLPHFRRHAALLSTVAFHSKDSTHLAAIYHTAYGGLHSVKGRFGKPAFVMWNSEWDKKADGLPFRDGITNTEFALNLGVDPKKTDPDNHIYGLKDWL